MSDKLLLKSAADGWVRVESESEGDHYVHEVIIAGNGVEISAGGRMTVHANTWAIQGELYPSLLIEAPQYYDPIERNKKRANDIVFYSDE